MQSAKICKINFFTASSAWVELSPERATHDLVSIPHKGFVFESDCGMGFYWRAPVAEFTNAWLKAKLGLRQFCVRGLKKARCQVLWACLTYNIQQWFRLRWKVRRMPTPA